jgi:electron transport complex protein RnfC
MVPGIFLEPFPGSTQEVVEGVPCPWETASREEIIQAVQEAGVVGLGGAAFPTHVKLSIPEGKHVDTLILNGAECEPYLTTDHRVMLEQRDDIYQGTRYLLKVTGAERAILGIEANKPDAAAHLRAAVPADLPFEVEVLPVKYPQGAEKMLITAILGREVPSGALPIDVHAICINVATAAELGRLLPRGRGIQERVITITGPAVKDKGNYRIPIGTPLRFLLSQVGVAEDVDRVFLGGPMMGQAASSLDISITKGTSGVVAWGDAEADKTHQQVYPCIRCGYCLEACPMFLNPSQLGILALVEEYERMATDHHLLDCFECGSCSFVCPSHIPLVQHFRMAKAGVRKAWAAAAAIGAGGTK